MKASVKSKLFLITRTAIFIALLIVVQALTASFGQLVTGSCVNFILAAAVLSSGFICGACTAIVSPFFAFMLGIGPQLIGIVPIISLGNFVYIAVLWLIARKFINKKTVMGVVMPFVAVVAASVIKFITLYAGVVKLFVALMGDGLKPKQVETFTAMFSFPQLFTALIGGAIAVPAVKAVLIAVSKNKKS